MADTIMAKIIKAMAGMRNPKRDATADVKKYKYTYATLEQVLSIVKPQLFAHELVLLQRVEHRDGEYYLTTSIADAAETLELDIRPITFTGDAQRDGSLETYYRRYALMTVFGLAGEDDDGAATKKPTGKDKGGDSPELKAAKLHFCDVCERRGGWKKYLDELKATDSGFEILKDVPDYWRRQADRIEDEIPVEDDES